MRCLLWYYQFPLLLFFFIVCSHTTLSFPSTSTEKTHICSPSESAALLRFKQAFLINSSASSCGTSYPKMESWKEDTDCCSWEGVSCSSLTVTGHVIGLDLSCSQLYGNFPSNSSLFLLKHLKSLDLSFNDFRHSRISAEFGQLTNLTHLDLSNSLFSGQVPSELSHLSKLVSLGLSSSFSAYNLRGHSEMKVGTTALRGLVHNLSEIRELFLGGVNMSSVDAGILMNLSSSLTFLDFSACELEGTIQDSFFHRPNLRHVQFDDNQKLAVHLPKSNWTSALEFLSLTGNLLSGQLPDSIGELKSLEFLYLTGCNLIGTIPTSIGNLSQISFLYLSVNHLTGQIPPSLTNLTQLLVLDISSNQLVGSIPDRSGNLSKLASLSLSYNLLNGPMPSWVFNLPSLLVLSLNDNRLTGHINEFKSISLFAIFLHGNMLQGQIPDSIFELVNIGALELSSNNFSGMVELHKFSKFKSLEWLDLSNNSLSLSTDNIFNHTLPKLKMLYLSSCNLSDFPIFLRASNNLETLDLSNNRISGPIPEWMFNHTLPKLKTLYLSSCNLSDFPIFLRASNNLETLDLSKNRISGPIPEWMWNIGKDTLSSLQLSNNFLTGSIKFPWQNVEFLELQYNHFEGLLPIPPTGTIFFSISKNNFSGEVSPLFCNLNSLEILDLSHNNLSGTVPDCLFNYSRSLSVLDLQSNSFHGTIPTRFTKGCSLTMLNLGGNQFQGLMPRSMANCRNLEILDIGNNYIDDTFPYWLDTLPELQVLVLRSNKFHSFVNDSKESARQPFSKLRVLDLSGNGFVGFLPTWYLENLKAVTNVNQGERVPQYMQESRASYAYSIILNIKGNIVEMEKVLTIFASLDLSKNNFEGVIPEVIGKLTSLKGLNLSHNNLGGHIPRSIGNLTNLEWLDLSSNKLIGKIPGELLYLTSLAVLKLSDNQLVGPIPGGKQFNTFENSSYEGNSGLCGFPLSKLCNETEKQKPPASPSESESGLEFGWKVVLIGYGCGLIFGAGGGCLVFLTGKPKWIVNLVDGKRHQKAKWRRRRKE